MSDLRPELGDFSSIVCFKAVVTGVEETLGKAAARVALVSAGRKRGVNLVGSLGLTGKGNDLDTACQMIAAALGSDGTRLCNVHSIRQEGDVIRVVVSDTVCMAGEADGSDRLCTFTLGAVHGAIEYLLGKQFFAKHTESVLRGGTHDVFVFTPR